LLLYNCIAASSEHRQAPRAAPRSAHLVTAPFQAGGLRSPVREPRLGRIAGRRAGSRAEWIEMTLRGGALVALVTIARLAVGGLSFVRLDRDSRRIGRHECGSGRIRGRCPSRL